MKQLTMEVWTITYCLGLGHETMVCAVCLSIFLWKAIRTKFGHLTIAVSLRLEVQIGGHASLNGCNFQRKRPGPHGVPPAPPCVHRLPCGLMIMIYNAGNLHKQWLCNDMVFGLQYDFLNHNDVLIIGTYFFLRKGTRKTTTDTKMG